MENKKPSNVPFIASVILCVLLGLYIGRYINWVKTPISDESYQNIKPNEIIDYNEEENKYLHIDDETAKKILISFDYSKVQSNFGESYKDIYFSNKPINSEYMVYLAIINIVDDFSTDCKMEKILSRQDVEKKIRELFGNREYQDVSFELDGLSVKYENGKYNITTSKCSSLDLMEDHIITEYLSNKKSNDKLIITVYSYLVTFDDNRYNYYQDVNHGSELLGHDMFLIDKNKIAKYNLIFGINEDKYYLEGFEKE